MSVNIKRRLRPGRKLVIGIPYVWLLLLFFPSLTTIVIAAVATVFFCWLHFWKKMSPMDLLKRVIVLLTGRTKGTKNIFKD